MMNRFTKILATAVLSLLLVMQGGLAMAKKGKGKAPVTMIMNVEGQIEYSKNGKKWKKVRRNKFLFPGYLIRTGADGKGTFLNQSTGASRALSGDTVVEITAEGAKATKGTLADAVKGGGNLVASLGNRFKKAQKYTTVRRGVKKDHKIKLKTATHKKNSAYHLSATWPQLVWNNEGKEYSYRLSVDDQTFDIAASEGNMVRFALNGMEPGKHLYSVEVIKGDAVVYKPKKRSSFIWLSADREQSILAAVPDDELMKAMVLDSEGVMVGSLDLYQRFFEGNRDDNDMRPMLIQNLHNLKLGKLKKIEANLFNVIRNEEE